jgi:hypothetical protein
MVVVAILLMRAPTRSALTLREFFNEVALELAILGMGATGGVFLDPRVSGSFQGNSAVYGILVVVGEICCAAAIVLTGSRIPRPPAPTCLLAGQPGCALAAAPVHPAAGVPVPGWLVVLQCFFDLFLGLVPIIATGGLVLLPKFLPK